MATTTETETETIAAASDHNIPAAALPAPSHNHEKVEEKTEQISKEKSELVAASKEADREEMAETSKPQFNEVEDKRIDESPLMEEQVKEADVPVVDVVVSENKQDATSFDAPVSDPKARVQEGKVTEGSVPVAESFEKKQQDTAPVSDYSEKPVVSEEAETDSKKPASGIQSEAAVEAKADSEEPPPALTLEAEVDSGNSSAAPEEAEVDSEKLAVAQRSEAETNFEKPATAQQAETDSEKPAAAQEAQAGSEIPVAAQGVEVVEKPEDESTPEVKPVTGTNTTDLAVYDEPKEVTELNAAEDSQKVEEEAFINNKSSTNGVSESESTVLDAAATVPEVKLEAYPMIEEPTAKEAVESSADGEKVIQKQTDTEDKGMTVDGHVAETTSAVVEVKEEAFESTKTVNFQHSSVKTATGKPKEEAVGPEQKDTTKREEDREEAAQQISVKDEIEQQDKLPQSEVTEEEVRPPRESLQDLIKREREESLQQKDNFEGNSSTDNDKPPAVSEDNDQKQVDKEATAEQPQQKKEDTTITEQQTPQGEQTSNTQEKQVIITEEVKLIEDNIEDGHHKTKGAQQSNVESDSCTLAQQNTEESQQEVKTITPNPSAPGAAKPAVKQLESSVPDANESKKEETPVPKSVEAENNGHVGEVIMTRDVVPNTQESSDAKEEQAIEEADISQDQTKEDIPAKPSSKQSSNIMSKVKHSFVKAKKAIIGKSPSSKTITTDATKGDIKVK